MDIYDDERLASLLRLLPAPPATWVEAAQQLPLVDRELEEILARAEADAAFRASLESDLEITLERAGYEPDVVLHRLLRRRLGK